jgi:GTP-binding protein
VVVAPVVETITLNRTIVTFAGSAASPDQFPRDGLPEVAFLGRSNVGKSSLLNALAGAPRLARVSSRPGRTRLINFFRVDSEMYLADLPGYGYARVPKSMREGWENLVTSYLVDRSPLALCVFLVDARHEPTAGDEMLRAFLGQRRMPYVVAANKIDALGRGQAKGRLRSLESGLAREARGVLGVSAESGEGIDSLWKTVRAAARAGRRED